MLLLACAVAISVDYSAYSKTSIDGQLRLSENGHKGGRCKVWKAVVISCLCMYLTIKYSCPVNVILIMQSL